MKSIIEKIEKILIPAIYLLLFAIAIIIVIVLCVGKLDGVIAVLSVGAFILGVIKDKWPDKFSSFLLFIVTFILLFALGLIVYLGNNIEDAIARVISVICLIASVLYMIGTAIKNNK